jgi:hypothetical protein
MLPRTQSELAVATARVSDVCTKRGIAIKPFFDMACKGFKGPKQFGHVTVGQVRVTLAQALGCARVSGKEVIGST